MRKVIPLKLWMSWTPEQRGVVASYYENMGWKWSLDLTDIDGEIAREIEKDYDEFREEMSLGGQRYDPGPE
jgi:hypothetical protein